MKHVPVQFVNVHGQPVDMAALRAAGAQKAREERASMIAPKRKPIVKNGYAAPPGTGPEDMTCKQCRHKHSFGGGGGGGKTFIKCDLRRASWTNGEGTDIRASSPACNKFEAKDPACEVQR